MTNITPFLFEGEALVRVVTKNDAPWFVAADVCRVLDIKNNRDALDKLDDDEKGVASTDTLGGRQEVSVVSESGLYTLILRSRDATKPGTIPHRFRRWVTGEVLPSIRKTGSYKAADPSHVIPPVTDEMRDQAMSLRLVTETRQTWGNKAAQQMWFKVGLLVVPAMYEDPAQGGLFSYTAFPRGAAHG